MDPISLAVGVALAAGAVLMDVRGVSYMKERIESHLEQQAKTTTLIVDQPTEKYVLDLDEKA